jgi:hypothetical protein
MTMLVCHSTADVAALGVFGEVSRAALQAIPLVEVHTVAVGVPSAASRVPAIVHSDVPWPGGRIPEIVVVGPPPSVKVASRSRAQV